MAYLDLVNHWRNFDKIDIWIVVVVSVVYVKFYKVLFNITGVIYERHLQKVQNLIVDTLVKLLDRMQPNF